MNASNPQSVTSAHIEIRTMRGGAQKAYIVGTRISVENVYVSHELQGLSADEVVDGYPHLSLAQVHAALAYYYEHADEIRDQLRECPKNSPNGWQPRRGRGIDVRRSRPD